VECGDLSPLSLAEHLGEGMNFSWFEPLEKES
jgi:hypothetical protein